VAEAKGELEVIYPPASIRAEPYVAWVDANVERKGTRAAAEAYLKFLYTDEAQRIIAAHYYRPINDELLKRYAPWAGAIELFPVTVAAKGGWGDAQRKFFAEGAIFDAIYQPRGQ
jgi:sulfate transport system substrate-binding protein